MPEFSNRDGVSVWATHTQNMGGTFISIGGATVACNLTPPPL